MLLSQTMTKEAAVNLVLGQKVLFFNTYHEKKKDHRARSVYWKSADLACLDPVFQPQHQKR